MRNHPPDAAVLRAACQLLTSMKYRIDDVLDALWRCPEISAVVLRDPLFQMLGTSSAALAPHGIDWLEAVGRDPAIDDDSWLAGRSGDAGADKHCADKPCADKPCARKARAGKARAGKARAGKPCAGKPCAESRLLYSIAPFSFTRLVLPSGTGGAEYRQLAADDLTLAEIDPALVIGGTYQRDWAVLSPRELDVINAKAAVAVPGLDTAYVRVGRLPLYVAVEGKNRVRAFREAGKSIIGFTGTVRFPEPGALKLHEIADSPGADAPDVAISDIESGAVRVIALPSVTVPVLEAYGVRWGRTLQPEAVDSSGRTFGAARRAVLEDLVRHFMHP